MGDPPQGASNSAWRNSGRLLVGVALMLCASCATIDHMPLDRAADDHRPATRSPAPTDPRFDHRLGPVDVDSRVLGAGRRHTVHRVSFPSAGDNGQPDRLVTFDYHRSARPGEHPVVLVLPIWGRHLYPSNAVVRTLTKRSRGAVHVINVLGESFLIDWPALGEATDEDGFIAIWEEGASREVTTVIDLRRLIDWAEARPEIDPDGIGVVGFSHGAMLAPTLAAHDPRVSALVLVMGGAQPHRIIARCQGSRTAIIQQRAAAVFGWSRDEMEARLEPIYGPVDPARYPGRVDPARVLIFEAGRDECVDERSRDALWDAMGRPERWVINASHRHAFYSMTPLHLNWMRRKIWGFFERVLLEGAAGSENDRDEVQ